MVPKKLPQKTKSFCTFHQSILSDVKQLQVQCGKDEVVVSFGLSREQPLSLNFTCCHVKVFRPGSSLKVCSKSMTAATVFNIGNGKDFLSHHDLQCGANKAMAGWSLKSVDSMFRFEFICCYLPATPGGWECEETFFPSYPSYCM